MPGAGGGEPRGRLASAALASSLIILFLLAAPAWAEGNASSGNVTVEEYIQIVNVSIEAVPGFYVDARCVNGTVELLVTVLSLDPVETVNVTIGSSRYTVELSRAAPMVYQGRLRVEGIEPGLATVTVSAGGADRSLQVSIPDCGGAAAAADELLQVVVPAALLAGFAARPSLEGAGLGAIAGGLTVFLLGLAGVGEASPELVAVPIVFGVVMLWLAER